MKDHHEHQQDLNDAEEVLSGVVFLGLTFMFDDDTWYQALALILNDRSPA